MSNNEKVLKEIKRLGYKIDDNGVLRNPKGKSLKGHVGSSGYKQVGLRVLGYQSYKMMFHRIQAYRKYGDKMFEKGMMVRHKDNDKMNNSFDNILIGTQSQNMMDIPKTKRSAMSGKAKYDHSKVIELSNKGFTITEISKDLDIPRGSVNWILTKSVKSRDLK